jgi:hypothetical protein
VSPKKIKNLINPLIIEKKHRKSQPFSIPHRLPLKKIVITKLNSFTPSMAMQKIF